MSKKTICSLDMMAKYADSILMCLRLKTSVNANLVSMSLYVPPYIRNKDVVEWVEDSQGITGREYTQRTKRGHRRSVERAIQWSLYMLRKKGLVYKANEPGIPRGYLAITSKGYESRYTHDYFSEAIKILQAESRGRRQSA